MEIASLTTVMASLKLAKDGVSAAMGVRDFNAVATALAGVNDQLLKAQESLFIYGARLAEVQDKLRDAEQELAELKRMRSERDKYTLVDMAKGLFVYRLNPKPSAGESLTGPIEPVHYLCQSCFDNRRHKVVLQPYGRGLVCNECKITFIPPDGGSLDYRRLSPGPYNPMAD